MSDLISRQAAIDLLKQMRKDGDMVPWEGKDVFARIRRLPSAQPEERTEKRTETRACDLISQQAAVELAMKYCPDDDGSVQCDGDIRGLLDELENLPSAQPEPKWIPCCERLPEEGQNCLVCDKGSIRIDTYIGHGNPYNWKWYVRDYEAWMPLPKPYKEEGTRHVLQILRVI